MIQEKLEYFRELEDRKETVLGSINEQGKLTPELKAKIDATLEKNGLRSYTFTSPISRSGVPRPPIAREMGLERAGAVPVGSAGGRAHAGQPRGESLVSEEKGVASAGEALEGARHIIAEWITENAELRKDVRGMMMSRGRGGEPGDPRAWKTPRAGNT